MTSHEIDYRILGEDIQIVEIELDPNETVIAEAGAMVYMEDGIMFETKMGDGSQADNGLLGKIFQAGSRLLTGESLFMTHFTNRGYGKRKVAFAAPHPGTIIPINLSSMPGNTLIAQKDSFLCAALGTKVSITFNQKIGSGFFGGEGFILEKLQGDGLAFVHAGGTIVEKQLNNETLRIDTGCIVAFEPTLSYDIQRAGNLKSMIFGGEGIFLATMRGTGRVWIQSMPLSKLIRTLSPAGGNTHKEGGSVLGGIANIFED
ncbi:TIGR00266 family protein [Pseudarcicella hirudinis]|uniref:TIGR00266 family protein n=1 Tax=Pseudarcicella hirudinis TaxID=1079859 RepID=A0A1I5X2H3_9BACT|nr:TIGR00266 family protein [Pseudarcicella hirudinis]SFQ25907.1 TIGR00266 family protein [Pseudarcicella hirudinis]